MNKLVTLTHSKLTVDISKIVAVGAIYENYKYINPYLFKVVFTSLEGGADLLVSNDEYFQAQDDYGVLMQAWQEFVNKGIK